MAEAATAGSGTLSNIFGHVAKHWAIHTLWMIPMAVMMMATPAPLGALAGAFEMLTKSFWGFFFEGGIVDLFNNTVSGDLWGSYEWGSMDMSEHASHNTAPSSAPVLSDSAKQILGLER